MQKTGQDRDMAKKRTNNRYGAWFIILLLLVGLVGFGAGGFSGNIRSIGTVGDRELSVQSYQRNLNNMINMVQQQRGQPLSFQEARQIGLDQAALNDMITSATLNTETDALGVSAGDQQVLEQLRTIPRFQGGNGFNRESYRYALRQMGQSEESFESELRDEISRTILQAAILGGVPPVEGFADTVVQFVGEQRSVTWAPVTVDNLASPLPGPTDANQQAFYDRNPEMFTLPEAREITYVWMTPDMIQSDMVVPDEAVAQLYETRHADFVQPERRLVERLVYLDQARADEARAQLDSGEVSFEDLVIERGLELADIDLGDVDQAALGAAGEAVFSAEPGDVVGPFSAAMGPALFRVNAVLAAQETTLEDAAPDLREELAAEAARNVIESQFDSTIDLLAGGVRLEDVAERTDMVLGQISWTPDMTDGIAAYESFRAAAASAAEGAFPEVVQLEDGGMFALRLDAITPPRVQPIDDVRETVIAGWEAAAKKEAILGRAEVIAASIQPDGAFEEQGLVPSLEEALTRRSFVEGTPPNFNTRIFEMQVGEVAVLETGDQAVIVRVEDIADPDPEDPLTQAQRETLATNAATGIAQDIFAAYVSQLRQQTDVAIDRNTIDAVHAQFR